MPAAMVFAGLVKRRAILRVSLAAASILILVGSIAFSAAVAVLGASAADTPSVCSQDGVVGQPASELNALPSQMLQPNEFWSSPDNREVGARAPAGRDRHIDSLVGDQGGHHEKAGIPCAGFGGVGGVEGGVYGRIHNSRAAIIVLLDPARNILRISEKAVHPSGRCGIPPGQARHNGPQQGAHGPADLLGTEVGRKLVPRVAHG